ncbi:MAG: cytochrome b/b6 domain-containing protein [Gammaproteobacteria bacterium]
MLYARFERFWHWSQTLLIMIMLVTGFEVHGTYALMGFERAAAVHSVTAWLLIGLWVFAWFWHLTTGEWKQYRPSAPERIIAMVRYYGFEIFQGKAHPFHREFSCKLNPLQCMAYLVLHVAISPIIWISGLLYLFYKSWSTIEAMGWLSLGTIAMIHTAAAYLMLAFVAVHLYLALTMDERPFSGLRAMVTGYERGGEEQPSGTK